MVRKVQARSAGVVKGRLSSTPARASCSARDGFPPAVPYAEHLKTAYGQGTSGLEGPTRRAGRREATLEARYDDGRNAGPADRTPYHLTKTGTAVTGATG